MKLLSNGGITGVIPPSDSPEWGSVVRTCVQPGCDRIAPAGICGPHYSKGLTELNTKPYYRRYMQAWRWRERDVRRVAGLGGWEDWE